jgi:hypothetical protein
MCISAGMCLYPPRLEDTALVRRLQYRSPPQALFQADEALIANYEVINQLDIKVLTRRDQLLRYSDVFRRRGGIAAGVERCMFVLRMFVGT